MNTNYFEVAKSWLSDSFDVKTQSEVRALMNGDQKELEDRFYRMLEFGTGGLRGVMGVGTNRMNRYTVGMATQGLANYMIKEYSSLPQISTVISYDNRNNSREFAKITSDVLLANGFKVYLFDNIRPTPELSFAIRHLRCQAGIMITASHNPKEYNGYKVFWEDGAQITSPHDINIIKEVSKITSPSEIKLSDSNFHPEMIGPQVDNLFLNSVLSLLLSPESIKRHNDIKIVYTPLHGTGVYLVPQALRQIGFNNIYNVREQDVSDGDFPTVLSPNPEDPAALKMAMDRADEVGADLVFATDPDADRVGVAIRDNTGKLMLLTGNQSASILIYYMLTRWQQLGKLTNNVYMVKTIVTTELIRAITDKFSVELYNVLTGFKYIAEVVRLNEGKKIFIAGGEESNGFNAGEFVRDKDSIVTCALFSECAAWLADSGKSIYSFLQQIYDEFGYYNEKLLSITKKGKDGGEQIQNMMKQLRENPPEDLVGSKVVKIIDYNNSDNIKYPKSNVLQFFSQDETVVTVRPSGTEPKIKFYFGAKGEGADEKIKKLLIQFNY
ncbi:MAG: phospho-sugar mutase [Bacteroidales bacterium]